MSFCYPKNRGLIGLGGTLFSGLSAYAKSNGKIDNEFQNTNLSEALSNHKIDNEFKSINMPKELKWYQFSAEKNAIYRQTFYSAEREIKKNVKKNRLRSHTWGVILDIHETILDNSCFLVNKSTIAKENFFEEFKKMNSQATQGAIAFLKSVHELGGYISLVTNQPIEFKNSTEKKLNKLGLKYDQILFSDAKTRKELSNADKNNRFKAVESGSSPSILPKQKILAWLGDNIQDIPKLKQEAIYENDLDDELYKEFGKKYFIFPNPIYGSWEGLKTNDGTRGACTSDAKLGSR